MRFIVVDDHPLYLEAVSRYLSRTFRKAEIQLFSSLSDALSFLAGATTDLLILDFSLPGMEVGEGLNRAVASAAPAPTLIMSGVARHDDVTACIAAGAKGFLPKTMEGQVFTDAVSIVLHGGTYVPAEFVSLSPAAPVASSPPPEDGVAPIDLSQRETDLLQMVGHGASNKEIARQLGLQEVTVKFYMTRLFRRLGVKNRSQAAVISNRMGLASNG